MIGASLPGTGDSGDSGDSGAYTGVCAPGDAWTGPIPAALYTTTPYESSYDAGLATLAAEMVANPSGTSGGASWLVSGATVSAIGRIQGSVNAVYIEDAAYGLLVNDDSTTTAAEIGDRVSFATDSYWSLEGEIQIEHTVG